MVLPSITIDRHVSVGDATPNRRGHPFVAYSIGAPLLIVTIASPESLLAAFGGRVLVAVGEEVEEGRGNIA